MTPVVPPLCDPNEESPFSISFKTIKPFVLPNSQSGDHRCTKNYNFITCIDLHCVINIDILFNYW